MADKSDRWHKFEADHRVEKRLAVSVSNIIKDIGLCCYLPSDIFGIVDQADLDRTSAKEEVINTFKIGDKVEVIVLRIQPEPERVSLGIKHIKPKHTGRHTGPEPPATGAPARPDPGSGPRPCGYSGNAKLAKITWDNWGVAA